MNDWVSDLIDFRLNTVDGRSMNSIEVTATENKRRRIAYSRSNTGSRSTMLLRCKQNLHAFTYVSKYSRPHAHAEAHDVINSSVIYSWINVTSRHRGPKRKRS